MVGMTSLKLFAFLTPCEYDDKLADCLTPFANLGEFVVLIWGSVVVFGNKKIIENIAAILQLLNIS